MLSSAALAPLLVRRGSGVARSVSGGRIDPVKRIYRDQWPPVPRQVGRRHGRLLPGPARRRQIGRAAYQADPRNDAGRCGQECPPTMPPRSRRIIYDAFYSPDARVRNKPARIELSRLTVRQYQNAVADLIGSFRDRPSGERRRSARAILTIPRLSSRCTASWSAPIRSAFRFRRIDPDPKQLNRHEFSHSWEGSLLAPDTGQYEFVVRTQHALGCT